MLLRIKLTVIENCTLAGVDMDYIPWLVINVQRAINNLSNKEMKQASDYANKLWPNNAKKIEPLCVNLVFKMTFWFHLTKLL